MNEKKLTDEEIVKALEHCERWLPCKECPCFVKNVTCICSGNEDIGTVIDLIHRQKTEIERMKNAYREGLEQGKFDSRVNIAELQEQVDELKEQLLIAKLQWLTEGYNNGVQAERNAQIFKPTVVELPKEITEQIQRQAVKDTAKEILEWLLDNAYVNKCIDLHVNEVKAKFRVRYGVEVE